MCQRNHQLQLCSCMEDAIVHLKESYKEEIKALERKEILTVLKWELVTYRPIYSNMIGLAHMPDDYLTKDFTQDFVLKELNEHTCFDFKYVPKEGDNLTFEIDWNFNRWGKSLKVKGYYVFMSFIFRDGEWIADFYDPFGYEQEEMLRKGFVKLKK